VSVIRGGEFLSQALTVAVREYSCADQRYADNLVDQGYEDSLVDKGYEDSLVDKGYEPSLVDLVRKPVKLLICEI